MDFNKIKLTLIPSPPDPRDWKIEKVYKAIKLPSVVDYTNDMQPVRDQGNQGSCVAMAASAMKEWQELQDVSLDEYMSPQFIYNNRENQNSEGMYTRDLMNILLSKGDCREVNFPYGNLNKPPKIAYDEALYYRIKAYAFIDTVEGLKLALYENGPVVIAFPVYNFTLEFWKKRSGEYLLGYHAVLVVGYNDIDKEFKIRNSWSKDWGLSGYTFMDYEDWGWQEEVLTTIDTDSDIFNPPEPEKKWYDKWWTWVVIGTIILIIYFIIR